METLSFQKASSLQMPFFLFDEKHIAKQVMIIKAAFDKYWKNASIAYSVKTNSLPYLAKFLCKQGISAEVVSEDEFDLVSKIGFGGARIVCNGPIKHAGWIDKILSQGCVLNIDSNSELNFVEQYAIGNPEKRIQVGLRVNNDIEDVFPNASTAGKNGSRFGFSLEVGELEKAIKRLQSITNVRIVGLHLHISTNLRSLEVYQYIVDKFDEIVRRFNLHDIEYLDVGGGFYGEVANKPQWSDYISSIASRLMDKGYSPQKLYIIIEPGVSLLSGCFSYYAKVEDVKDTVRSHFVVLNGSRNHIDPLMHKTIKSYFYSLCKSEPSELFDKPQILVGYTCLEYDTFFSLEHEQELKVGDIVRFDKVGAYTLTFSPLFISWFPTVYSINDGNVTVVRERWTVNEFLQKSKI